EQNCKDRTRPLQHVPMRVVGSVPGQPQRGMVMAIGDEFGIRPEERFQRFEDLCTGKRLAERRASIPGVEDTQDAAVVVSNYGRTLLLNMLPDGLFELHDGLGGQGIRQLEKAVMAEKLDLFRCQCSHTPFSLLFL